MWLEKSVDRDSQQKLYVQIYSILKERVEEGEWPSGVKIPTEDELCRIYDVSKATIRLAIAELVREGLLRRRQGKGTFVSYPVNHMGMAMRTRLTENMFGEGVKVEREILSKGPREPSLEIRNYLEQEGPVFQITCRRLVDGEPACMEESFLPFRLVPDINSEEICRKSFYEFIQENAKRKISKVLQTIELSQLAREAANVLRIPEASPVLLMHRLFIGVEGRPLAYTRLYGAGGKYKILTEFERIR